MFIPLLGKAGGVLAETTGSFFLINVNLRERYLNSVIITFK